LFNNASNKLKSALHKLSNERFTTHITTLKHNDQSIWKPIKSRKRPRLQLPPIRKNGTPPGPWAQSDAEKVVLFARHLAEVFYSHDNIPDQEIENKLAANVLDSEKLSAFTTNEILNVVKKLHPLKAPGIDRITALMIQQLPPEGLQTLRHIYNSILKTRLLASNSKTSESDYGAKTRKKTHTRYRYIDLSVYYPCCQNYLKSFSQMNPTPWTGCHGTNLVFTKALNYSTMPPACGHY
jgi:hypothetical protein